jgi:RNA 2',3'-cyclic 3'-phosphodiesterase
MRLFIAITIPDNIKNSIFGMQKQIKDAKITWVAKKHLHVTLKFLGDIKENNIEEIKERLNISAKKITLALGNIGFSPNNEDPKVMFITLNPEEKIIQLQQKIDGELLTLLNLEQQFKAHLTIGRIKNIRRKKEFISSVNDVKVNKESFEITAFHLMKSTITAKGSIYEVMHTVPLS